MEIEDIIDETIDNFPTDEALQILERLEIFICRRKAEKYEKLKNE